MSPYIIGLVAIAAVGCLTLLGRVSGLADCAAATLAYFGAYTLVVAGCGAIVISRIAALGTLTNTSHAAVAAVYILVWVAVLTTAKPLAREGCDSLAILVVRIRMLVLSRLDFDFGFPYVVVRRIWRSRSWKTNLYYVR